MPITHRSENTIVFSDFDAARTWLHGKNGT